MNEPRNPYAPPTAHVADKDERVDSSGPGRFIPYGRTRPVGRGAGWIGDAWRVFRAQMGMWFAALILMFIAYIVVSMIPLVNWVAGLLVPFAYAGIALAGDEQRRTGTFELKALLGGFEKQRLPRLLAVGAVSLLASVIFIIALYIFIGGDIVGVMTGSSVADPETFLSGKFWFALLIGFVLSLPIAFATYLAPQLVVLHDQPAVTAMKMSLVGTARNILPVILFAICSFLMLMVSMLPLFLGLLITLPILAITNYTVYRDIFVDDES